MSALLLCTASRDLRTAMVEEWTLGVVFLVSFFGEEVKGGGEADL